MKDIKVMNKNSDKTKKREAPISLLASQLRRRGSCPIIETSNFLNLTPNMYVYPYMPTTPQKHAPVAVNK